MNAPLISTEHQRFDGSRPPPGPRRSHSVAREPRDDVWMVADGHESNKKYHVDQDMLDTIKGLYIYIHIHIRIRTVGVGRWCADSKSPCIASSFKVVRHPDSCTAAQLRCVNPGSVFGASVVDVSHFHHLFYHHLTLKMDENGDL